MSYTRILYIAGFLPLAVLFYHIVPKRFRKYALLLINMAFYFNWSRKLVVIYLASSIFVYMSCWLLDKIELKEKDKCIKKRKKNVVTFFSIVFLLVVLFKLKYWNFFIEIFNSFFSSNLQVKRLILPLGISYYSLQLISLIVDVKTNKIKNPSLVDVLVYTSFFPTIVLGPITRFKEVVPQIRKADGASFNDLKEGFIRIFWGLLKKSVIADGIAPVVALIFKSYTHIGSISLLGIGLCTLQIYMDFSGSVDMAIGSAKLLGITLPENFNQPFFAKDASEFWRRWHMTLGHFFRDYIFYPISLAKPVQKMSKWTKKHINKSVARLVGPIIALFFVWLANGLWHGPQSTYILYGLYYFIFILLDLLLEKPMQSFYQKTGVSSDSFGVKTLRFIKLIIIVCLGEALFLSPNLSAFGMMVKSIFSNFRGQELSAFLSIVSITKAEWLVVGIGFVLVSLFNIAKEKGWDWKQSFFSSHGSIQVLVMYGLVVAYILFATYGPGFDHVAMMYAGF
ncbi:MBOAT family protein [Bulleidia extructa W1219]|uniref:MBOAT family protein n=1 Tax=Bulleidia extructa W1219 TaxID=679192 RepID=D2MQB8_9FIRM|nr:MBOAT family O-acyltransferase [Bulleidia extructa]EFC05187.1 MBOAT family protein [Bulleidia extructa W1219]